MSKIDVQGVETNAKKILSTIEVLAGYFNTLTEEVANIRTNPGYTEEFKNEKIAELTDQSRETAMKTLNSVETSIEELEKVCVKNDETYDFTNVEFTPCLQLISTCQKELPYETVEGIINKFLGNKQVLIALAGVAKGHNKDIFKKYIYDSSVEIKALNKAFTTFYQSYPSSVIELRKIKSIIGKIMDGYGIQYEDPEDTFAVICDMQMRRSMGLSSGLSEWIK